MTDLNQRAIEAAAQHEAAEIRRRANYDGIPQELRAFDRWGYYTDEKIPVSVLGVKAGWPATYAKKIPSTYFKANVAATWASWDAVYEHRQVAPACLGPSLAPTLDMEIVCFDLDDPIRSLQTVVKEFEKEGKTVSQEQAHEYIKGCNKTLSAIMKWAFHVGAWIEFSKSGTGIHVLVFGKLSHHKYEIAKTGHIWTARQLLHMTGKRHPKSALTIPRPQTDLDELMAYLSKNRAIKAVALDVNPDDIDRRGESELDSTKLGIESMAQIERWGRQLDLTDEQVVEKLARASREFCTKGILHVNANLKDNSWSTQMKNLIGDLDKITGDPVQVKRIVEHSYAYENAGVSTERQEDRADRTSRRLAKELFRARTSNDALLERYARTKYNIKNTPRGADGFPLIDARDFIQPTNAPLLPDLPDEERQRLEAAAQRAAARYKARNPKPQ